MIGAIIGDTVGSVYEFDNTKDYNFTILTPRSVYTDDSVMSFAVARWLLDDPLHSPEVLVDTVVRFARECPCPMGGYGGMFYKWLFYPDSIRSCEDGVRRPYGSWGNGSAMRCSACGWFFDTLEETERVAGISAAITHDHPEGIKGAQATAAAIWMARNGKTKKEICAYIESRYGYDISGTWEEYNRTYHWEDSCQGTVPPAIVCFLESSHFEDAIRKAVSIGGDSDTLACITGGIAEAFYGDIPAGLLEFTYGKLPQEFRDILSEMAECTDYGKVFRKYPLVDL